MEALGILFVIVFCLAPYCWLFYKGIGLRVRLLFASVTGLLIVCIMATFDFFGVNSFTSVIYLYFLFVWMSILLNITVILVSWIYGKLKRL
jgi:hypothetical protein